MLPREKLGFGRQARGMNLTRTVGSMRKGISIRMPDLVFPFPQVSEDALARTLRWAEFDNSKEIAHCPQVVGAAIVHISIESGILLRTSSGEPKFV